jgi:hypothetical protein
MQELRGGVSINNASSFPFCDAEEQTQLNNLKTVQDTDVFTWLSVHLCELVTQFVAVDLTPANWT